MNKKYIYLLVAFFSGALLWLLPPPVGVDLRAWHLFAIFVGTIIGIVLSPFPMGCMALIGLTFTLLTKTLTFAEAFSGFSNEIVWLIVFAYFISRGFIKTGIGARLSYYFMILFGRKTLGLGYGLALTDLILAPAIPSSTARSGGIILPIIKSLSNTFESRPHQPTARRVGAFLTTVSFQSACITSAMFLTSMAANPLIVEIAGNFGITLTWGSWALAGLLPGLISLILVPFLIYRIFPPLIKETPNAGAFAKEELAKMGPIKQNEWIMFAVFVFLVALWIAGPLWDIKATVTALIGLVILLVANVLNWQDIRSEQDAWETLVWFAVLLMMATELNKLGLTQWFSTFATAHIQNLSWPAAFFFLAVIYFYTHYFFASNLAHVGAMYAAFLAAAISLGAPHGLAAYTLAFFSSLFGGLTQYSSGPAAVLFGAGYVSVGDWWRVGFIISLVNFFIWLIIGGLYWNFLGLW